MQIHIKSADCLKLYPGNTLASIENSPNAQFKLSSRNLSIFQDSKLIAKIVNTSIGHDVFESKIILYKPKHNKKEIILEVYGNEEQIARILHLVKQHNQYSNYKTPLQQDFSYESKDSVLCSSKEANLRGFINLFLIFSVLNYSRLIMENLLKHKTMFKDTVN